MLTSLRRTIIALLLCAPAAGQSFTTELVIDGIPGPTRVAPAPGDTTSLFAIADALGILIFRDGQFLPEPFLDLSAEITTTRGLMDFAFHPDYEANGRFFVVVYDDNLDTKVVEYERSQDPDRADPASARIVFGPEPQPSNAHNWNCLAFGPDGMLYVGTGEAVANANTTDDFAQDLSSPHGKVLRLDVDLPPPHIPPDNPFVGMPNVEEAVWLYGLRQPWRFAFDRLTGDLWVADVGFNNREEIDFIPAGSPGGIDFGWGCIEGTLCQNFPACPPPCGSPAIVPPIYEYNHDLGECAIIGGYVYRGSEIPDLYGRYLFADHCTGRVWSLRSDGGPAYDLREETASFVGPGGSPIQFIGSFGEDESGELYVVERGNGGRIYRLVPNLCDAESYCISAPNSAGAGASIGYTGSTSIALGSFTLTALGAPPNQPGVFFYGAGALELPFGDGFRCVGSGGLPAGTFRLNPPLSGAPDGSFARRVDFDLPPAGMGPGEITPASSWYFQLWYRDPAAAGSGFNTSDGLRATFCP